ncbi:MAG: hypothetical protein IQL11_10985 [Bacteroidales bacterium]|nr:hypothetical protein [Bacteroidales bacterium]
MKSTVILKVITALCFFSTACNLKSGHIKNEDGQILKVPSDYQTIANAVENSSDGDWIILAPGTYYEMKIDLNKSVAISSEWKISGDVSKIDQTIIDSQDSILFNLMKDGIEISGLRIINGDHPLNITAKATIKYNHFVRTLDAMSFEGSGGGYAGYNTVENDRDDGLDLDIRLGGNNRGSDIVIENNTIINSNDDGMEIRLYDYPNQNIHYTIRENKITGSNNAGIQIISYDIFTGKTFDIHHNIIQNCKVGLGCMEGTNTRENIAGATTMDELICFYNNTLIDNQMGATGGNSLIAVNNIVMGNTLGGFKKFGRNSAAINNLFFSNGGDDFVDFNESVKMEGNIFSSDPYIDNNTFMPSSNSLCIDAGRKKFEQNGKILIEVPEKYISGSVPDIGAVERK